jgi:hypothetical protein
MTMELKVDHDREGELCTGIYVRALVDGKWTNADIGELDRESLLFWLRSRGGVNIWAESVVCQLLGHPPLMEDNLDQLRARREEAQERVNQAAREATAADATDWDDALTVLKRALAAFDEAQK